MEGSVRTTAMLGHYTLFIDGAPQEGTFSTGDIEGAAEAIVAILAAELS